MRYSLGKLSVSTLTPSPSSSFTTSLHRNRAQKGSSAQDYFANLRNLCVVKTIKVHVGSHLTTEGGHLTAEALLTK